MNSRRTSKKQEKPIWIPIVALIACVVVLFNPQIIGTPLTAFSSWFGDKAAERIQTDMENQGIIPTTTTTSP